MTVLPLERIAAIRSDPGRRARGVVQHAPDRSRPFVPEEYTQLYYTPSYAALTREQRIRYNQLFGLRVNEYIMMLERDFVDPALHALRSRALHLGSPQLVQAMAAMREEEALHYRVFAELNRRCEPQAYQRSDLWLMRLHGYERAALRVMQSGLRWLPFALWIIIAMEESSIALATAMVRGRESALGPIDTAFLEVHREHAKDEARHIHVDVHLVRACLQSLPPAWRALNARLFMGFMRDMTAPKATGTGARVVRRLVTEFPELAKIEAEMIAGLVALRDHEAFQHGLFNRRVTPLSFALYDEEPALARLGSILKAYERP